jgi:hypothetical protein
VIGRTPPQSSPWKGEEACENKEKENGFSDTKQ